MTLDPRERTFEVDGRQIHALEFGDAASPGVRPAIFSHGTGLHAWMWSTQAAALSDRLHSIAVDHRGHGDSAGDFADYHWSSIARDLTRVIALAGFDQPVGVGHSMGGAVLLLAEAASPGLFSHLVLVDPIILPEEVYARPITIERQPMAAKTIKRRADWPSHEAMIESYSRKPPFNSWRADQLELYVRHGAVPKDEGGVEGGVRLKCPPRIEAVCYLGGHETNPWPLLPRVKAPTLILQGTEADTRELVRVDRIAATLGAPRTEVRHLPGGHFLPMEHPNIVTTAIAEWIAQ